MFDSALDSEQAFDTMRAVARTRVRRRRTIVLLSVAVIGAAWAGPIARAVVGPATVEPVSRTSYVVRPGDSVWGIAERVSPGTDPRPLVDAIVQTNHLDATALTPGQTLVIPSS
jgi:nucleoid-associated protein YgaU